MSRWIEISAALAGADDVHNTAHENVPQKLDSIPTRSDVSPSVRSNRHREVTSSVREFVAI